MPTMRAFIIYFLPLFTILGAILAQSDNLQAEFAVTNLNTHTCPPTVNITTGISEIARFLVEKSFDAILVRLKAANVLLKARMNEARNERTCVSSDGVHFHYCTIRFNSIPLDAHMITQHLNLRKSILRRAFLLKQMNVLLEMKFQDGVVTIQKAGAVVGGYEECNLNTGFNNTAFIDWMGVVIGKFVKSASCTL